jgi:hypothetical protein
MVTKGASGMLELNQILEDIKNRITRLNEEQQTLDAEAEGVRQRQAENARKREEAQHALRFYMSEAGLSTLELVQENDGRYSGLGIVDVTVEVLRASGKPMKTAEIAEAAIEGGFETKAENVSNTFFGSLRREDKSDRRRIIKTGKGQWGLPEWETEGWSK